MAVPHAEATTSISRTWGSADIGFGGPNIEVLTVKDKAADGHGVFVQINKIENVKYWDKDNSSGSGTGYFFRYGTIKTFRLCQNAGVCTSWYAT